LRKTVRKHAFELKLMDLIGHAEMDKEIQKTVTDIVESQDSLEIDKQIPLELDETELRRYLDIVIKEVKHKDIEIP
jgi:hypothetical protein